MGFYFVLLANSSPTGNPSTCSSDWRANLNRLVSCDISCLVINLNGIFCLGFNATGPLEGLGEGGPDFDPPRYTRYNTAPMAAMASTPPRY